MGLFSWIWSFFYNSNKQDSVSDSSETDILDTSESQITHLRVDNVYGVYGIYFLLLQKQVHQEHQEDEEISDFYLVRSETSDRSDLCGQLEHYQDQDQESTASTIEPFD